MAGAVCFADRYAELEHSWYPTLRTKAYEGWGTRLLLDGLGRRNRCALKGDEALRLAAGFAKPGEVGLHLAVGCEGLERGVEDGGGAMVQGPLNAVVHPLAVAAGADDAGVAQIGQMPRNLGLALLENFNEVADADLAAIHEIEQAEASAVGKRSEEAGQVERFGRARHFYNIRLDRYVA
jgi:hypothetical protein